MTMQQCPDSRDWLAAATCLWCAVLGLAAGCQAPEPKPEPLPRILGNAPPQPPRQKIDVAKVPTRDDIVAVYTFYPQAPWLYDSGDRAVGFRVRVYFHSARTGKGVFVSGDVLVWLRAIERLADGQRVRREVQTWDFDPQDAMPWRIKREALPGFSYGFALSWPEELDLAGKEVEIQFGYERQDGTLVHGSPRRFRVPLSGEPPLPIVKDSNGESP